MKRTRPEFMNNPVAKKNSVRRFFPSLANRACRYVIASAALAALLSACGHTPSAGDVPPDANFSANILDNGTKLFTFSTHLPHQPRDGENMPRRGDQQGEERPRPHADMAGASKKALQAMLLENGYCREGYVVLEMYEDRTSYVMRGECRDAADDNDRARYAHH